MRLYCDLKQNSSTLKDLCDIACKNQDVLDICQVGKLPGTPSADARNVFPMNWRFFPMLDPQVYILIEHKLQWQV